MLSRLATVRPAATTPKLARLFASHVGGDLARSGLGWTELDLVRTKTVSALACASIAALATTVVPLGPIAVALSAYVGFVAPSLWLAEVVKRRERASDGALVTFVEWIEALVASGRPVEAAVVDVAAAGVGAPLLDELLARAAATYTLGGPLFAALVSEAERGGLGSLAALARELARARDLGRGALTVIRDERDRLRTRERARGLEAAGQVEGRLMLVLVLCYLPALMLLVVIPLFLGLLDGLFGS